MNTDVAISYKAKLIEIDNKIREIEKIGFDVTKIREELDSIKIENNNDKIYNSLILSMDNFNSKHTALYDILTLSSKK